MAKRKSLDSISASNPLFGADEQGGTAAAELHPAQDRLSPALHLRNTDLPAGHVHPPKKSRERKTTRPR